MGEDSPMTERWKYPFYLIAVILLVMWIFG